MNIVDSPRSPPFRLYLVGGVAAALIAAAIALVVTLIATPIYRAETAVSIRPRISDLGSAEAAARLVQNYAVWVDSKAYAARLSEKQRDGLTEGAIVQNVRTRGDSDRMLVIIQSEDSNAARAASTVNNLADLLVAEIAIPERVSDPVRGLEIDVIDRASVPGSAVWPRIEIALPLAAMLGFGLSSAAIWLVWPMARKRNE